MNNFISLIAYYETALINSKAEESAHLELAMFKRLDVRVTFMFEAKTC